MTPIPVVLHVEDDPSILRIVSRELNRHGYQVVSIDDPTRVIAVLLETNARVVVLDVDLPGVDGLELLKQIKKHDGGIQVVMVTGMVSMTTLLQSMRWGAEACVFKAIKEFERLHNALEAAFAKIDRWWNTLHELTSRKPLVHPLAAVGSEEQL